ncbi:MAG: hypothetical protein ABL931_04245 [Usitatibacteraceae bacterium]
MPVRELSPAPVAVIVILSHRAAKIVRQVNTAPVEKCHIEFQVRAMQ